VERNEDARYGATISLPAQRWRGHTTADGEEFNYEDADVGIPVDEIREKGEVGPKTDL
jgi:hypothetical protein